jgi:hypothetical protein
MDLPERHVEVGCVADRIATGHDIERPVGKPEIRYASDREPDAIALVPEFREVDHRGSQVDRIHGPPRIPVLQPECFSFAALARLISLSSIASVTAHIAGSGSRPSGTFSHENR